MAVIMRQRYLIIAVSLFLSLFTAFHAAAQGEDPIIVLFYQEGCESCVEMEDLLAGMTVDAPASVIARYEINDPESAQLLPALSRVFGVETPTVVPIVFVADDVFVGMGRAQELALRDTISDCLRDGCESPIAKLPSEQLRKDLPRLVLFLAVFAALAWLQLR
jgi:thiol-disulfide isomerase/thioredoxin